MRKILEVISALWLFPLFIYYLILPSKRRHIIRIDLERIKNYYNNYWFSSSLFLTLIYYIKNTYYRRLFYYRIGKISILFMWYAPGEKTFLIGARMMNGGVLVHHPFATVINARSIGKNFTFHQCTTIGNKSDNNENLIPVIGDNVTLGANVCIIGNISIGNNVIVGAGSVVVKDIPNNAIVVGNPARIISFVEKNDLLINQ